MARQEEYSIIQEVLEILNQDGDKKYARIIELVLNKVMKIERAEALKAEPYERTEERTGYANGYKNKTIALASGKVLLKIPQVRGGLEFYPSSVEKGIRSERSLKLAIAEMYVKGVSTRRVSDIVEILCGTSVSSGQVSRLSKELDEEVKQWKERPIGQIKYLVLDATYESVRIDHRSIGAAILVAFGVDYEGRRHVLDTSVAIDEAEVNWRVFLENLAKRGLNGLIMITSDAHPGLRAAMKSVFPGILWQRCQFHLQQNAGAYVSRKEDRSEVASDIRKIFNAPDLENAERYLLSFVDKYKDRCPKLSQWADQNIRDGFSVFHLPEQHRRKLRTSNLAERQMKEIKRRTKVVGIFPNTNSLERLVGTLLIELEEQWNTEKRYLQEIPDCLTSKEIYRKDVA